MYRTMFTNLERAFIRMRGACASDWQTDRHSQPACRAKTSREKEKLENKKDM